MNSVAEKTAADAQAFMNSVEAATHLLDFAQSGGPAAVQQQQRQQPVLLEGEPPLKRVKTEPVEEEDLAVLQEFLDGIGASTFGLDMAASDLPQASAEDSDDSSIEEIN